MQHHAVLSTAIRRLADGPASRSRAEGRPAPPCGPRPPSGWPPAGEPGFVGRACIAFAITVSAMMVIALLMIGLRSLGAAG